MGIVHNAPANGQITNDGKYLERVVYYQTVLRIIKHHVGTWGSGIRLIDEYTHICIPNAWCFS